MNKTKIIATIGPSTKDKEIIKQLIKSGMDVARINLDHSDYDFCTDIVNKINEVNEELDTNVAIMFDTRGPEIRTGKVTGGSAKLEKGSKIRIYSEELLGDYTKFSVDYPNFVDEINYDSIIKISDGHIVLQVLDKGKDYVLCEVLNDGVLEDHKGVNVPGVRFNMPFLSDQDRDDILLANTLNVDFLALSFVHSHEDILEVNDLLINMGNDHIGIIAKVENEMAYEDLDEIIKVSEGVMVARGDLGVQVPMERVPGMQKAMINKCHMAGKVSIVATEMMTSMECNSIPTRAEVSDVANAVLDGTDAVMLSNETTIGLYPVETLETMERIIETAEKDVDYLDFMDRAIRTETRDTTGMLAYDVAETSNYLKCKAIFAPTMSGYTARKISRFRPSCPIIAASPSLATVKSLALHFGVLPVLIGELKSFDRIIEISKKMTKDIVEIEPGDKIVLTGGYPFREVKHTNFMKIEEL
jgi:pyruvate kinase